MLELDGDRVGLWLFFLHLMVCYYQYNPNRLVVYGRIRIGRAGDHARRPLMMSELFCMAS